jgi:hypothetical protein
VAATTALIYFSNPQVLERLDKLAKELGRGRGEAIRVLFDRADGNFQKLRHDVNNELQPAVLYAQSLEGSCPSRDEPKKIQRAIVRARAVMANPLTPSGRGGAEA